MQAYELYKNGNMTWADAKKKSKLGHAYPPIDLEGYREHHRRDVLSDLIGIKNRVTHMEHNRAFFEALLSQNIVVTVANKDVVSAYKSLLEPRYVSDEELVRELINRGIKTDDGKTFYKEEVKRTIIEPYLF